MKNNKINLSVGRFGSIQHLTTLIFLILCTNLLNAQDFETSLCQAAKDLVNPIYAIVEVPQDDGTIKYIEILKSETDKISQLENEYDFIKNEWIEIEDKFTYIETLDNQEKPTQRNVKVYFAKDYQDTSYIELVKEAHTRIEIVPASRKTVTERVLVKLGYTKSVTTPAKYKITADTILVKPASYEAPKTLPVEYETVVEIKEINPATTRWIKRYSKERTCCFSLNPEDCQIWVLIEVPARYETIVKSVLKTPARHKELNTIPAEYKIVYDTVLIEPMKFEQVFIPPVFKTITKAVVKEPAHTRTVEIPAEYKTVVIKGFDKKKPFETFELPVEYETITYTNIEPAIKKALLVPAQYKTDTIQGLNTGSSPEYCRARIKEAYIDTVYLPAGCEGSKTKRVVKLKNPLDTFITVNIKTNDIIRHYKPKKTEEITNEIVLGDIQIFPNPTTDIINIQSKESIEQVQVFDANGQLVLTQNYENENSIQLAINDLASALYSVQVKTNKDLQTSKIIKK